MDQPTQNAYNRYAAELDDFYGTGISAAVTLIKNFSSAGSRVLDIGAGNGRDVYHLLRGGYDAWGLEPSSGLRTRGCIRFPEITDRILEGALPSSWPSSLTPDREGLFDAVILSAVIQHIGDGEIQESLTIIRKVLKPGGVCLLVHPSAYPADENLRDPKGRLYRIRTAEEYRLLFEGIGLREEYCGFVDDKSGRPGIGWVRQVFS